jgi:phosphatidate cytidylyltransferase
VTRVASAAVLLVVVFGAIWGLPAWATLPLIAIVAGLAAGEVAGLAAAAGAPAPAGFVGLAASLVAVAVALEPMAMAGSSARLVEVVLMAVVFAAGALALIAGPPAPAVLTRAAVMFMAPLYVGLPLGALGWVRAALGAEALTWFLVVIAASDTAQLYTGKLLGRRKLAPVVSPGKTVEGAIGGLVAAVIAGGALAPWWLPADPPLVAAGLALFLAGAGIVGDLFESLLKRSAGRKDASSLIPGHGGVLDRVDSYLLAAPLFYLYLVSQ